jgi:hypothetical protein
MVLGIISDGIPAGSHLEKESSTMKVIVYLLGFGYIAVRSCLILYTSKIVDGLKSLFQTYEFKSLSVIPAVFGLLFLISASSTIHPWGFRIFGLLALGEAILTFIDPQKWYSQWLIGI